MNITPLYELKERLEASVIAGTALLSEDFRLKRAIEQILPLAKASPIFDKIYQSSQQLLTEDKKPKGQSLLEILALLNAVLTTQAAIGVEGSITTLTIHTNEDNITAPSTSTSENPTVDCFSDIDFISSKSNDCRSNICSDNKYSVLAPVLEALTTSGSGHYKLLTEAHEKNPELFLDFRLKPALIYALNAGYAELADHVEQWLSRADRSFLPLLKKGFDPKGKKEMVRRVHVIEAIAGAEENNWYLSMLEEAEKNVRAALIFALHACPENNDRLLSLVKTEKGQCKKAALWSLAKISTPQNQEFWETQLKKSADCANYFILATNEFSSDLIANRLQQILDQLQIQAEAGDFQIKDKDLQTLQHLFSALYGKASPNLCQMYRRIACDSLLDRLKQKDKPAQYNNDRFSMQNVVPISQLIADKLTQSLIFCQNKYLFDLADELYHTYGGDFLKPALTAALLSQPSGQVYETFGERFLQSQAENNDSLAEKERKAFLSTFANLIWHPAQNAYVFQWHCYDEIRDRIFSQQSSLYEPLDSRWFSLFVDSSLNTNGQFKKAFLLPSGYYTFNNLDWDYILEDLICPTNPQICNLLADYFYQRACASKQVKKYFPMLNKCGFTKGQGLVVKQMKRPTQYFGLMKNLIMEAPMPPADKIKELETIRELIETKQIMIVNWTDENYQQLYDALQMALPHTK